MIGFPGAVWDDAAVGDAAGQYGRACGDLPPVAGQSLGKATRNPYWFGRDHLWRAISIRKTAAEAPDFLFPKPHFFDTLPSLHCISTHGPSV
jgi:hypothetical protein